MKIFFLFQFGNSIITTPLKRRKVISQETSVAPVSLSCQSSSDTIVIKCRSVRIGTLFQLLIEPVIVSTHYALYYQL